MASHIKCIRIRSVYPDSLQTHPQLQQGREWGRAHLAVYGAARCLRLCEQVQHGLIFAHFVVVACATTPLSANARNTGVILPLPLPQNSVRASGHARIKPAGGTTKGRDTDRRSGTFEVTRLASVLALELFVLAPQLPVV